MACMQHWRSGECVRGRADYREQSLRPCWLADAAADCRSVQVACETSPPPARTDSALIYSDERSYDDDDEHAHRA